MGDCSENKVLKIFQSNKISLKESSRINRESRNQSGKPISRVTPPLKTSISL